MSAPALRPARCAGCGTEVGAGLLRCPACGRLVHAAELTRLAAEAGAAAAAGERERALGLWREALALLPEDAPQARDIAQRVAGLSAEVDQGGHARRPPPSLLARGGLVGAALLILWKFKFALVFLLTKGKLLLLGLTKAGTLFSMFASLGVYWAAWGWKFAAGLVASLYVHEMGHVAALRRFGIPASAPMFVPRLGAFVRLRARPANVIEDARVGLAGPWWGLAAALVAAGVWRLTGWASWGAIAAVGAWINLFNLTPVWELDGARGFRALDRRQRWLATGAVAIAWAVSRQGMLVLPLIAGGVQALRPAAAEPDRRTLLEYVALVGALAAVSVIPVGS